MVHLLALEHAVHVAVLAEQVGREDVVGDLGFLQAQDVGLLLAKQPLDDAEPGADRIHVPGGDLDAVAHVLALSHFWLAEQIKGPRSGGMERGPTKRSSRKGSKRARVTGGNPKQIAGSMDPFTKRNLTRR